jgi:hypothetical protein
MADYHPLIARAIDGLGTSTGEARRALYERARAALVAQLRSIEPALSEADITRERLALEDAIRKVEAETVRKARAEPRPAAPPLRPSPSSRPQAPSAPPLPPRREPPISPLSERAPAPRPDAQRPEPSRPIARPEPPPFRDPDDFLPNDPRQSAAPTSARSRLLNARTSPISREGRAAPIGREGLKDFRDVVNDVDDLGAASAQSAQSARDTRDSYGAARQFSHDDEPPLHGRNEPRFNPEGSDFVDDEAPPLRSLEPSEETDDDQPMSPPHFARPQQPRSREPEDHYEEPRPPRSYRGLAKLAVVLIVLAGLTATISWQWSHITGAYNYFSHMRSRQAQTTPAPTAEPKFSGRVPQEQNAGQTPGSGATDNQAGPAVAQRVVLYEEDPNDPQGKRFVGSAVWHTETVSPGTGLAPELEVRADIEVPERHMTVTWTLRRNTDQALPASHTIEVMFNLPPDFPGGGIANVPGVLMKESEQARGVPLAGLAVKVTNGFFLIGLSAVDADVQRNMQLLKERPWFDIPLVYNNGGRAILAMEKGPPGDRAFADAFAAWGK